MNENHINKIRNVFLAYTFALVYGDRAVKVYYGKSKDAVLEFVYDAIRKNFLPLSYFSTLNEHKYRNHYKIDFYKDYVKTSIPEKSSKIEEGLKKYIENYSQNKVVSYIENVVRWEVLEERFKKSIDKDFIPSHININSAEHLPVIIKAFIDGRIKVNNIFFCIESNDLLHGRNPLYICNEEENELQLANTEFNNFDFSCTIDLTNYKQNMRTAMKSGKKLTLRDRIMNDIDKLVHEKGEGNVITVKEIICIYNKNVDKRKQLKSHDANKRIQNYISYYRKHRANDLTLGRVMQDEYTIEVNKSSSEI